MKSIEELISGLESDLEKRKHAASSKTPTTASSATDARSRREAFVDLDATSVTDAASAGIGVPDCPICGGLGYIRLDVPVGHPHFGKLFPCTCRMEEIAEQRDEAMRSMSNLKALERFTFDTFSADGMGLSPTRQRNLQHAYQAALAFAKHPEGWLLLMGGYGCGKTHLAAAIANHVLSQGIVPLFVTVPDLLDHLRATFAPSSPQPYSDRFNQVRNSPLLILDDLGTENATPWALEKLFQLLNHRYMMRLPTVITTNQQLERMDARLRSRFADPLLVEVVTIEAPDYRHGGAQNLASNLNMLPYYEDMTLESFDLRRQDLEPEEARNLASALQLAKTYAADPEGWVVFTGTYGVGKTHLAAAIANERLRLGDTALLVVVPDLLDYLRAAFNPNSNLSLGRRFEEVRRAPLLVLDDLGTESATPWAKEKLFQLVNYRYVARLPTVVTTVAKVQDLDPKLAIRFSDVSRCTVFEVKIPPYLGGATKSAGRLSGQRRRSRRP